MNPINKKNKKQAGVALIISILTIGILISIVLSLSAIFIPKIKLAKDTRDSVAAIYASESAIEWCHYVKRIRSTAAPIMTNGANYKDSTGGAVDESDCFLNPLKTVGSYRGTTRSLEISY